MPIRTTVVKSEVAKTLQNMSFEQKTIAWLMSDGWEVYAPIVDNGHKTDILISDGAHFYRIQIKTVSVDGGKTQKVLNKWQGVDIDLVIYYAREGEWGYVASAFKGKKRALNHKEHKYFNSTKKKDFLKAFHEI